MIDTADIRLLVPVVPLGLASITGFLPVEFTRGVLE
jgi:hypothetical protein